MRRRRYRFHAPAKTARSVPLMRTRAEAALKLGPRRESGGLGGAREAETRPRLRPFNADATATS
jgi:hypothetical protein